ncbi:Bud-site selection protein [Leucogyrophana mollusca]|uniref:Bud-site selection protein n=1 Tax=Leucogyrophana mollusca TaxID=85980 RepID=A0ACB8B1Q6_9AGAM|nr:Bud-site selection protein [Leucogyrophana mollusca]
MPPPDKTRGTKRKRRAVDNKAEDIGTKVAQKLHHDVREVRKAAKKAKLFETQKVLKKLKDLRPKDATAKDIPDIEAQLEILKHIDYESMANTALKTKIKKDRVLSDDPHVQTAVAVELASDVVVPATVGTALGKVQSRILSSKVLASEISSVIEGLKRLLHPPPKDADVLGDGEGDLISPPSKKTKRAEAKPTTREKVTLEDDEGSNLGDDDPDDHSNADEGDGGGWESGTVSDGENIAEGDWESHSANGDSDDEDGTNDTESGSQSDDESGDVSVTRKRPAPPDTAQMKKGKANAQSAFLPSLSVGFTRGDSDSEWSDSEEKVADEIKKNRRGQRARRAIWEKKFGRNANHVKKQKETAEPFKRPRSGVVPTDQRRERNNRFAQRQSHPDHPSHRSVPQKHQPQFSQASDSGWNSRSAKGSVGSRPSLGGPSQNRRDERPLHPSWEAKKKQKSASIVPAQGTKIVF